MKRWVWTLSIPFFLAACGDDDEGPSRGSFEAQLSGAVQASFSGEAFFGVSEGETAEETAFAIVLANRGATRIIGFSRPDTTVPAVGTYTLGVNDEVDPEQWSAIFLSGSGETLESFFVSTEGTLRITSVAGGRIVGEFDFVGLELDPFSEDPGTDEITVTGRFEAVRQPDSPFFSSVPAGIAAER